MPSRKPRLRKLAQPPKVVVRLTANERQRVVRELLEIIVPVKRAAVARDLERTLGLWASQLANVPNVTLRSDFVSRAEPLAARAKTLWSVIEREDDLLVLAAYKGFVDPYALRAQLSGFEQLLAWVKSEKPKRGGERRSYRKRVNDDWKSQMRDWFDRHAPAMPTRERTRRQSAFLRLAQLAVERALSHG